MDAKKKRKFERWNCSICLEENESSKTCEFCGSMKDEKKNKREKNDDSTGNSISKKVNVMKHGSLIPWTTKYSPSNIDDLKTTLDKKKVDTLLELLINGVTGIGSRLIIIHGPTGSGKSTAVEVLSKHSNYALREWDSSNETAFENGDGPYERQTDRFSRLLNESCYPSLNLRGKNEIGTKGTVVLIDSLPKSKEQSFKISQNILHDCTLRLMNNKTIRTCIVFLLTTEDDSSPSRAQLCEVIGEQNVDISIEFHFNPIPPGRLLKKLKAVAEIEKISIEEAEVIANAASEGDLRNALINLQFLSMTDDAKKKIKKPIMSKIEEEGEGLTRTSSIKKDLSFNMLHGVGKLIRGKKENSIGFQPEDVARACCLEPDSLGMFCFENYFKYASVANCDLKSYEYMINCLIDADSIITSNWSLLERSGGEDDVTASEALAESIISRCAQSWQLFSSGDGKFSQLITINKPQIFSIQKENKRILNQAMGFLRNQNSSAGAKSYLWETVPFSQQIGNYDSFRNLVGFRCLSTSLSSACTKVSESILIEDEFLDDPVEE